VAGSTAQSVAWDADARTLSSLDRDFVLGIDFGGTKIALATAGLDGEPIESTRLDTQAPLGAEQAVARALERAHDLMAVTRQTRGGRCLAVGAVSPGIVYPDRIALAPNVPGWEALRLRELLTQSLGDTPTEIGTDVKSAALAEARWGSLRDADPAILVILGTGLAAAIAIGGEVLHGANGASGEIGYSVSSLGGRGVAHGRAPLEELAGGRAIGERVSALLGETLTAADAFDHPGPSARALVKEALAELAVHVANMAIVVDPARIAVGGGLMGHREIVLAALEERLRTAVPFPPELVPARFIDDGSLRGAIALALDAAVPALTTSEEEQ
jgi:glucokinase